MKQPSFCTLKTRKSEADCKPGECETCGWNPKVEAARRKKIRSEHAERHEYFVTCPRCMARYEVTDEIQELVAL